MGLFEDYVAIFEKTTSKNIQEKIDVGEELVLFVGRASCPFCQRFAPKINSVAAKLEQKVYFVDSEDFDDDNLSSFRELHKIKTVPGLLVFKNNEIKVVCDSSVTEEFITKFITE